MIQIILATLFAALSDAHVGQLIELLGETLKAVKEGLQVVWAALAPFMIAYLAYRQAVNKSKLTKAIDENTAANREALDKANGHNEKIAKVVEVQQSMAKVLGRPPENALIREVEDRV